MVGVRKLNKVKTTKKESKVAAAALNKKVELEGGGGDEMLAGLSLDDFINSDRESAADDSVYDEDGADLDEGDDGNAEDDDEDAVEEDSDDDAGDESAAKKHKKALDKLATSDPEFYKFLSENDRELLEFDTSDSDSEAGGQIHKPPPTEALEAASDESDFEDEESAAKRPANVITQSMVDKWQQQLQGDKPLKTIIDVVSAFRSAVHSVTEEKEGSTRFKVQGGAAFNAIVRLCIVDLIPAFKHFLKVPAGEKVNVDRCKSWVKIRLTVKSYLADVIRLLSTLSDSSLLSVTLKHIHQLIPFYSAFVKLSRVLCKRLVTVWCTADDTVRVIAFLSILRLARTQPAQLLEPIIKAMYMSYARNCKFTSPSTWPGINFMRRSLVEIMALQESLTYKHAFLYIRQLAIHLRNAITLKKKDSIVTVYNWQFVHCLHLWSSLLGALPDSQSLRPLLYPLVQIAIGTINLVPTGRYYPLRFHVVSIMNQLSSDTGVFIPLLPFLLEVLQNHKFEKKPTKVSMKPLDLSCVLRVSQSQLAESGYRDAVVDMLYDRLLETLQCHSHLVSFPEMALPVSLQLKKFIKKCPLANYTKKMKQLVDKVQETVNFVDRHRSQVTFDLADTKAVLALENQMKQTTTPLQTYHTSWKKVRDREMAVRIAKRPEMEKGDKLPQMKMARVKTEDEDKEFDGLFPSDLSGDEDDDDDGLRFTLKEERSGLKRKADEEQKETRKKQAKADEEVASKKKNTELAKKTKTPIKNIGAPEEGDVQDEVRDFNMSDDEEEASMDGSVLGEQCSKQEDSEDEEDDEDDDEDGEDDEDDDEEE